MRPVEHPSGTYRYLPAASSYSAGVAAIAGHHILALRFQRPSPLAKGFEVIDRWLRDQELPATALVGIELRSPNPLAIDVFADHNEEYRQLLAARGLFDGEANPIARTNVVPTWEAPSELSLHGAFVIRPGESFGAPDYMIAGAGEIAGGVVDWDAIVAVGDVTPAGLVAKVDNVVSQLLERLGALDLDPVTPNMVNVYTAHEIEGLGAILADRLPSVRNEGFVRWSARPPVVDIEFEMDLRHVSEWRML
jgi:hypothetical protein